MPSFKILFVPLMEKGHTNPLIGIIQHLQQLGHTVGCFGAQRDLIVEQFLRAGIDCAWYPAESLPGSTVASAHKTALLRNPRKMLLWRALGISNSLTPRPLAIMRDAIAAFAPDVVCVDPLAYTASVAAELEGVPWASISTMMLAAADPSWQCPYTDVAKDLEPTILDKMRALGVTNIRLARSEAVSPWLNTMFVMEDFAPRAWSGNRHSWYVGPSKALGNRGDEPAFPWDKLRRDVPVIYVSGGGGQALGFGSAEILAICRSLGPQEAQFVCALHDLMDEPFVRDLPESCIAVRYAPQVRLLKDVADVAVIHGGFNSVTECLTHGRPMLVIPLGHEQPVQARAIEARGVGLSIDLSSLTAETCRGALLRLLDPAEGFGQRLETLRESYATNGAITAGDLIVRLAHTRQPVFPPVD